MQESLNIYADGILGPDTVVRFYDKNKLPKTDAAYQNASRKRAEAAAAKEKAAKEKAGPKETGDKGGEGDTITAIPVEKPPAGTKILGDHILGGHDECFPSSPGWCAIPYGDVTPSLSGGKTTYDPGEKLTINLAFYLDKHWVWFPEINGEFESLGPLNDKRILAFRTREDLYFKLTPDADVVYGLPRGSYGTSLDGPM